MHRTICLENSLSSTTTSNGINFINVHNAGCFLPSFFEEISHSGCSKTCAEDATHESATKEWFFKDPEAIPPIISTKSEPAMAKKGTWASVATALARRVFPQPGGPNSKAPLGILAPIAYKPKRCEQKSWMQSRNARNCAHSELLWSFQVVHKLHDLNFGFM